MSSDLAFGLENAQWPALLVDASGIVRRSNAAAVNAFGGVVDGKGSLLSAIWAPGNQATAEAFLGRWQRASSASVPLKLRTKEGATAEFATYVAPFTKDEAGYFILQFFAVPTVSAPLRAAGAEPTTVEAGLAQKQKLDCALQLTRTVASDFNNALTSILGHTSLILSKMEPKHPWRSSLAEVEKSAEKAAEIAHDLAAFSLAEKEPKNQSAGNLNDIVRRTIDLFKKSNSGPIAWKLELEKKLYSVNFDEAKLQQALIKILDNGVQAIGAQGSIEVRTSNRDVVEPTQDGAARLAAGSYVLIEFTDSGVGIPSEVLPRIFEPFFTTKGTGHRGLGLAWVYGIVTNHGGAVAVSSQPGKGTSVRVYLPALKKIVKDVRFEDDALEGTQTVLIVDDEDLLLTMAEMVLSSYGYKVLTANSGQAGLDVFSKKAGEIDLVITDLVMPRMSGRELIERIRKVRSDVKVVCATGYLRSGSAPEDEFYLQKPFTSQDLLRKVKEVLS